MIVQSVSGRRSNALGNIVQQDYELQEVWSNVKDENWKAIKMTLGVKAEEIRDVKTLLILWLPPTLRSSHPHFPHQAIPTLHNDISSIHRSASNFAFTNHFLDRNESYFSPNRRYDVPQGLSQDSFPVLDCKSSGSLCIPFFNYFAGTYIMD